jgi:NDP-sugar pyrophosphorylase family protein
MAISVKKFWQKKMSFMKSKIKTAFVLGAGLGTRLRPLTEKMPKPLLPVRGRPLITYAFEHLQTVGVERLIVNTHYCADCYEAAFPDSQWNGIPIIFRHEPILLETGGGIKNIEDLVKGETIMVYNGDVWADFPLVPLLQRHFRETEEVTLALRSQGGPLHVGVDETQRVTSIRQEQEVKQWCLFTGIYVVSPSFLKRFQPEEVKSVIPAFREMIAEGKGPAGVLIDEGNWSDLGCVASYEAANGKS